MASEYEFSLYSPDGQPVAILSKIVSASLARAVNAVGALQMIIPLDLSSRLPNGYTLNSYERDSRLVIRRRASPLYPWKLVGDTIWFIRLVEFRLNQQGEYELQVTAYDANHIVQRRIVAYDAGTPQADKTGEADAVIKEIMDENFGPAATDPDRDLSAFLSIAADLPAGTTPSIEKQFSRKNVLSVCQEICQTSTVNGVWLGFDVVCQSYNQFQFRTFTNQRGVDRRWPNGTNPLILAPEYNNLSQAEYTFDATSEVTFVYAGGTGEGEDRLVATASDPLRLEASPFNRIEEWYDSRNTTEETALEDDAEAELRKKRPRELFAGQINENQVALFGVHFDFGDYVTADFNGKKSNCRIDAFKIDLNENGETINVQLRADAAGEE